MFIEAANSVKTYTFFVWDLNPFRNIFDKNMIVASADGATGLKQEFYG